MQYVISFLEGIITFISPCLLPMLPIYISYFAGGGERTTRKTLLGALGFVSGFSVIFVAMGALAGTIGSFLREYQTMVNVISGLVVILFGLNFLGIFKWNLFRGGGKTVNSHEMGFFSAMLFGMVFSLRLDALCGRIPRFCSDAGLSAGSCNRRYADAALLFAGTWYSFSSQCCFDRLSEVSLQLDQKTLPDHQYCQRLFPDIGWYSDGDRNTGTATQPA